MRNRSLVHACVFVVAISAVAACSSDDDASDATSATVAPSLTDVVGSAPDHPNVGTIPPQSTVDDQSIGPPSQDEIGPPPETRACALSNAADVTPLLELEPGGSIERDRAGVLVCSLTSIDEQRVASIRIVSVDAEPLPAAQLDALAAAPGAQPVDGFGDVAIWVDGALNILVGDEMVTLSLFPPTALDDDALRAATVEWAEFAMPRYRPPSPD